MVSVKLKNESLKLERQSNFNKWTKNKIEYFKKYLGKRGRTFEWKFTTTTTTTTLTSTRNFPESRVLSDNFLSSLHRWAGSGKLRHPLNAWNRDNPRRLLHFRVKMCHIRFKETTSRKMTIVVKNLLGFLPLAWTKGLAGLTFLIILMNVRWGEVA